MWLSLWIADCCFLTPGGAALICVWHTHTSDLWPVVVALLWLCGYFFRYGVVIARPWDPVCLGWALKSPFLYDVASKPGPLMYSWEGLTPICREP